MSAARLAAALPWVAAYAYLVGRLKALYFAKSLGVPLESFAPTAVDLLFESWYVLQNAAYFALVVWLAWRLRTIVWILVAALYGLIPLAAHYTLAEYPHTLMKFAPPLLILIAWWRHPQERAHWWRSDSTGGRAGAALCLLLVASWGISAAKHFGSYDARRILADPDRWLQPISLEWRESPSDSLSGSFLLGAGEGRLLLLDPGPPPRVVRPDAGKIRSWSVEAPRERQPGRQYF